MIDHIGIRVPNIEAAIDFYTALLSATSTAYDKGWHGIQLNDNEPARIFLQHNPEKVTCNGYFSFRMDYPEQVDECYERALALNAEIMSEPKMRDEYGIAYYGFVLKDVNGNVFGIMSKD